MNEKMSPAIAKPFPRHEAIALLKEMREALAAALRVMDDSTDKGIWTRFIAETDKAGVKERIGVRVQWFITEHDKP